MPLLSLIVPMYNEGEAIGLFFGRVIPVLEAIDADWEILCVDDGSKDDTLSQIRDAARSEPRIRYIALSRNFGKEAALTAGLHHARGQAVVPIDADLQDPPELIPELVEKWREGYKVVLATRRKRDGDNWLKRNSAKAFYYLLKQMTSFEMPENTGDFRLIDAVVVNSICAMPERTRFMKGIFAWVGYSTARVYFDRPARSAGAAKQSYMHLWSLAKDGIFSFTTLPLKLSTYMGVFISVVAISYGGWLVLRTLLFGVELRGYASMMTAILVLGGLQLISLGIIGEYIGRIYRESKSRPLFIIEETSPDE